MCQGVFVFKFMKFSSRLDFRMYKDFTPIKKKLVLKRALYPYSRIFFAMNYSKNYFNLTDLSRVTTSLKFSPLSA